MSNRGCAIYKCTPNRNDIRYYFPNPKTHLPLFQKWLISTGNSEIGISTPDQIYSQHRVCQKHFLPQDIDNEFKLLDGALPKIYLPFKEAKTLDLVKIENSPINVYNQKLCCLEFVDVESGKRVGLFQLKGDFNSNKEVDNEDLNTVFNFVTSLEVKRRTNPFAKYENICVCRICLRAIRKKEGQTLIGDSVKAKRVESMLLELITIDLTVTENPIICKECVQFIAEAYNFKMVCKSSEERIRMFSTSNKKIVNLFELTEQNQLSKLYETMNIENSGESLTNDDPQGVINTIDVYEHRDTNKMDLNKHENINKMDVYEHKSTNKMDTDKHLATKHMDVDSHTSMKMMKSDFVEEETNGPSRYEFDKCFNIDYSNHLSDLEDHWYEEGHKIDDDDNLLEEEKFVVADKSVYDFLRDHDYEANSELPSGDDVLNPKFDYLFDKNKFSGISGSHWRILRNRMQRLGRTKMKGNGPFLCQFCGLMISRNSYESLIKHIYRKHSKEVGRFSCDVCSRSFQKSHNLYLHQRAGHHNIRCECCDKVFKCKNSYVVHKRYHKNGRSVQCHVCGKRLAKRHLYRHMVTHRSNSQRKKYACHICDRIFNYKTVLTKHMEFHLNKGEYECKICGKILSYESSLDRHVKIIHQNKGKHKCEICNVTYYKIETLRTHMKNKHEIGRAGRFKCAVCHKTYFSKSYYERHVLNKHGNNVGGFLVCQICRYKCKNEQNLKKHCVKKHTVYVGEPVREASISKKK